jgi:hypothetical protein
MDINMSSTTSINQAAKVASEVFANHDKWEAALGKYVRLFSDIEYASVWILHVLAQKEDIENFCNKEFQNRCHSANEMVNKYCSTRNKELGKRWKKFFDEAICHGRTVRNKVLHNPLMTSINEDADTGELSAKVEIALMRRNGQYLSYEMLQQHLTDLHKLRDEWRSLRAETSLLVFFEPQANLE